MRASFTLLSREGPRNLNTPGQSADFWVWTGLYLGRILCPPLPAGLIMTGALTKPPLITTRAAELRILRSKQCETTPDVTPPLWVGAYKGTASSKVAGRMVTVSCLTTCSFLIFKILACAFGSWELARLSPRPSSLPSLRFWVVGAG